jgi:hypothetical protein
MNICQRRIPRMHLAIPAPLPPLLLSMTKKKTWEQRSRYRALVLGFPRIYEMLRPATWGSRLTRCRKFLSSSDNSLVVVRLACWVWVSFGDVRCVFPRPSAVADPAKDDARKGAYKIDIRRQSYEDEMLSMLHFERSWAHGIIRPSISIFSSLFSRYPLLSSVLNLLWLFDLWQQRAAFIWPDQRRIKKDKQKEIIK